MLRDSVREVGGDGGMKGLGEELAGAFVVRVELLIGGLDVLCRRTDPRRDAAADEVGEFVDDRAAVGDLGDVGGGELPGLGVVDLLLEVRGLPALSLLDLVRQTRTLLLAPAGVGLLAGDPGGQLLLPDEPGDPRVLVGLGLVRPLLVEPGLLSDALGVEAGLLGVEAGAGGDGIGVQTLPGGLLELLARELGVEAGLVVGDDLLGGGGGAHHGPEPLGVEAAGEGAGPGLLVELVEAPDAAEGVLGAFPGLGGEPGADGVDGRADAVPGDGDEARLAGHGDHGRGEGLGGGGDGVFAGEVWEAEDRERARVEGEDGRLHVGEGGDAVAEVEARGGGAGGSAHAGLPGRGHHRRFARRGLRRLHLWWVCQRWGYG